MRLLSWLSLPPRHPEELRRQRQELRRQHQLNIAGAEHQLVLFLVTSLLPVLVLPWAKGNASLMESLVVPVVMTLVVIQSIRTLPRFDNRPLSGRMFRLFQSLGALSALGCWLLLLPGVWAVRQAHVTVMGLLAVFLTFSAIRLVQMLALVPRVNLRVLAGAAGGYVHLGLTGGVIATMMQNHDPTTFNLGHSVDHETILERLVYFSYVTVSTLGFGDVVPTNVFGERFVVLLGLSSTLYVSLLVGLLLGRFVAPSEPGALTPEELEDALHESRWGP